MEIVKLKTSEVCGNPEQPRKKFDPKHIRDLAESIKADGQRQAGEVIPVGLITDLAEADYTLGENIKYIIIGGECRYRACKEAETTYDAVICKTPLTRREILVRAIVENEQRKDPTPIENARAYKNLEDSGLSIEDIAKKTGKRSSYIKARIKLLDLNEVYQIALSGGGITIGQANQLTRLSSSGQDTLVRLIESGKCRTYKNVCDAADEILQAEQQLGMFEPPKPMNKEEKRSINLVEGIITGSMKIIKKGFGKDNEIIISRNLSKHKAIKLADSIELIIRHLKILENSLRKVAIAREIG